MLLITINSNRNEEIVKYPVLKFSVSTQIPHYLICFVESGINAESPCLNYISDVMRWSYVICVLREDTGRAGLWACMIGPAISLQGLNRIMASRTSNAYLCIYIFNHSPLSSFLMSTVCPSGPPNQVFEGIIAGWKIGLFAGADLWQ